MSLNRDDFPMLNDNEFRLLANEKSIKDNKSGINKRPFNGDGYKTSEERKVGYKNLKKHGFIYFDDKVLKNPFIQPNDISVLI